MLNTLVLLPSRLPADVPEPSADDDAKTWIVVGIVAVVAVVAVAVGLVLRRKGKRAAATAAEGSGDGRRQ
jgi:hypothetical protein